MCQYKESLRFNSIIEIDAYNCRIKESYRKSISSKMILYCLSLRFSGDKLQRHKETTDKRIYKNC